MVNFILEKYFARLFFEEKTILMIIIGVVMYTTLQLKNISTSLICSLVFIGICSRSAKTPFFETETDDETIIKSTEVEARNFSSFLGYFQGGTRNSLSFSPFSRPISRMTPDFS